MKDEKIYLGKMEVYKLTLIQKNILLLLIKKSIKNINTINYELNSCNVKELINKLCLPGNNYGEQVARLLIEIGKLVGHNIYYSRNNIFYYAPLFKLMCVDFDLHLNENGNLQWIFNDEVGTVILKLLEENI